MCPFLSLKKSPCFGSEHHSCVCTYSARYVPFYYFHTSPPTLPFLFASDLNFLPS